MAQSTIDKVTEFLTRIGKLDIDGAGDYLHNDAVMSFPYMEQLADVTGKAAIVEQIKATVPQVLDGMNFTFDAWYETTDPDVVITEYHSKCPRKGRSDFYENSYVGIFGFRDGKIILYKEYLNPMKVAIYDDNLGPAGHS